MSPRILNLISFDNDRFEVPLETASASGLIKTMFDDDDAMFDDQDNDIPLPNVSSTILAKVCVYMTHYDGKSQQPKIPAPIPNDGDLKSFISAWDADFLGEDPAVYVHLVHAADYMDIQGLYELAAVAMASHMRGMSKTEMCNYVGMTPYPSHETERVMEELKWTKEVLK